LYLIVYVYCVSHELIKRISGVECVQKHANICENDSSGCRACIFMFNISFYDSFGNNLNGKKLAYKYITTISPCFRKKTIPPLKKKTISKN